MSAIRGYNTSRGKKETTDNKLMIFLSPDVRNWVVDLAIEKGVTPSAMIEALLLRAKDQDRTNMRGHDIS